MAAPAQRQSPSPDNLPTQLTSLVGREHEIVDICRLLLQDDVHLLTLTGPPGIGKTRLAIQVAGNLRARFPDGSYFVNLAPVHDPGLVLGAIATTMGLRPHGNQPLAGLLEQFLSGKHLLLLLDNFEQVVPARLAIAQLLRAAPNLKVLVTSRELLHLSGEHTFVVPPLPLPAEERLTGARGRREGRPPSPEYLARYAAVRLFVQRAQALNLDFRLDAENAPVVAAICRRLDGLPLAIELAAARVRHLPPAAIWQRLSHGFAVLTDGPRDRPDRQRTLWAAIEWSHALLDGPEQQLFRRLAAFHNGSTLEAIAAVCNADQDIGVDPLVGVSSLIDKSLLSPAPGVRGEPRYLFLETIREFAWEKLDASGEAPAVSRQHATYFADLAARAEPLLKGPDQVAWLDRLEVEQANFRAALNWAYTHDITVGLRLAAGLGTFWNRRGHLQEGRERSLALLTRAREQGVDRTPSMARVLYTVGLSAFYQGDFVLARSVLRESVDLYGELALETAGSGRAESLNVLGIIESRLEDISARRRSHEEALALAEASGDTWGVGRSLYQLGHTARLSGNLDEAHARFEESLAIFQECGDRFNIGLALLGLGQMVKRQGAYRAAQDLLQQSLTIFRELRDLWGTSSTLYSLACVAQEMKDYGRAQILHEENLEYIRELGAQIDLAETLERLGRIAYFQSEYAHAQELQTRALTLFRDLGDKIGVALGLLHVAGIVAGAVWETVDHPPQRGRGQRASAVAAVEPVVRVLAAADAQFARLGYRLDPEGQELCKAYIEAARAVLGEQAFADAWEQAHALSAEEALALALALQIPGRSPKAARSGRGRAEARERKGIFGGLTRRELQVAVLVAAGKSNREIADTLVITERTVEGHVSRILARLGFRSRAQISAWAVEHGLQPPPPDLLSPRTRRRSPGRNGAAKNTCFCPRFQVVSTVFYAPNRATIFMMPANPSPGARIEAGRSIIPGYRREYER